MHFHTIRSIMKGINCTYLLLQKVSFCGMCPLLWRSSLNQHQAATKYHFPAQIILVEQTLKTFPAIATRIMLNLHQYQMTFFGLSGQAGSQKYTWRVSRNKQDGRISMSVLPPGHSNNSVTCPGCPVDALLNWGIGGARSEN